MERCEAGAWQESGNNCEKVGQGAGWLQRVWKLEWSRSWTPLRVQLHVNVNCRCEEVDILYVNVGISSLCPRSVWEKSAP